MALSSQQAFSGFLDRLSKKFPDVTPAVVSHNGFVLASNLEGQEERKIGANACMVADVSGQMLSDETETDPERRASKEIETSLIVGRKKYVVIARLSDDAFIVAMGRNKAQVSDCMKLCLECAKEMKQLIKEGGLLFST